MNPFLKNLTVFSNSVDIIDEALLEDLGVIIKKYIENAFPECTYEVQFEGTPDIVHGDIVKRLESTNEWTNGAATGTPILDEQKKYKGQTTFAFCEQENLWVTTKNHKPLSSKEAEPEQLWPNGPDYSDVPKYWDYHKNDFQTSIIIPFISARESIGFLNIETKEHIPYNKSIADQLVNLCDSISKIRALYTSNRTRTENTKESFKNLEELALSLIHI